MTLGKRIKQLREKKNISQTSLSNILKIPNQSISNYERDYRQPDYETLLKIADYFEVTTDYLISGKTNTNGNLSFFNIEGLNEEEIEDIKRHIEYVKWKAAEKK